MKFHVVRIHLNCYKVIQSFMDYHEAATFLVSCNLRTGAVVLRQGSTGRRITFEEIEKEMKKC